MTKNITSKVSSMPVNDNGIVCSKHSSRIHSRLLLSIPSLLFLCFSNEKNVRASSTNEEIMSTVVKASRRHVNILWVHVNERAWRGLRADLVSFSCICNTRPVDM